MTYPAYDINWESSISMSRGPTTGLSQARKRPYKPHKHKRLGTACLNCRERRVKCDRVQPCSACCNKGIHEDCVFTYSTQDQEPVRQAFELRRLRVLVEGLNLENETLKEDLKALLQKKEPLHDDRTVLYSKTCADPEPVKTIASTLLPPSPTSKITAPLQQQSSFPLEKPRRNPSTIRKKSSVSQTCGACQPDPCGGKVCKKSACSNRERRGSSKLHESNKKPKRFKNADTDLHRQKSLQPVAEIQAVMATFEPAANLPIPTAPDSNPSSLERVIVKNTSPQESIESEKDLPERWPTAATPIITPSTLPQDNTSFNIVNDSYNGDHTIGANGSYRTNTSFSSTESSSYDMLPQTNALPQTDTLKYPTQDIPIYVGYTMTPSMDVPIAMTESDFCGISWSPISSSMQSPLHDIGGGHGNPQQCSSFDYGLTIPDFNFTIGSEFQPASCYWRNSCG